MVPWLVQSGTGPVVTVSSRVRFARNLSGYAFPARASVVTRQRILHELCRAVPHLPVAQPAIIGEMVDFGEVDRSVLLERRLISQELCQGGPGTGVIIDSGETVSIMINEEDHVRLQCVRQGFELEQAWQQASEVESALSSVLEFAFRPELGFLTSCPSNVGTGLRASVMLHLPALALTGHIEAVANASRRLGVAVRGIFGEGTEAVSDFYQISNQSTLGETDEQIVSRLSRVIRRLVAHEQSAQLRLVRRERARLYDHVGRAYGILSEARILTAHEALTHLSAVRLGVGLGLFSTLNNAALTELTLAVQPGHLQARGGRKMDGAERDVRRAELVRASLRRFGD